MIPRSSLRLVARVLGTLVLALAAAGLCVALHTPLPWMIGPLLATALATILNWPTLSWNPLRNLGQWTIATALGLYFTPQVTVLVGSLWWAIVLSVVWTLALGYGFGVWLHWVNAPRLSGLDRVTTYFASAIGGASEMTLLAERESARTDLVAAAHSLRVFIVTVTVPFVMQSIGWHGLDPVPATLRQVDPLGLLALIALTGLGALALRQLGRANPWFLGALLVSMALAMNGITLSGVPTWMSSAAQLVIGVSLGVRFTADFIHTAPRWLATVVIGTLGMTVLCAGFGAVLGALTDLPMPTMVLGGAPGGIAEMAITAKVLQLGVAVVTAFQVCRLIAVLLLVAPLYHWLKRHRGL